MLTFFIWLVFLTIRNAYMVCFFNVMVVILRREQMTTYRPNC